MGHAVRSRVVIQHLLDAGHEVEIMASSRACDFLRKHFEQLGVNRIHGFHLIYEENRVRKGKTLWSNVQTGLSQLPQNIAAYFDLIENFAPQVVISDFESWTYLFGIMHRLPVISIDNMQIINRCTLPEPIIAGAEPEFQFTKAFIKVPSTRTPTITRQHSLSSSRRTLKCTPSAQQYTKSASARLRSWNSRCSSWPVLVSRVITDADNPAEPKSSPNAGVKSPELIPCRYISAAPPTPWATYGTTAQ